MSLAMQQVLAMRHSRSVVFFGCLFSTIVMTILSAFVGWAAPNLISRKLAHNITTILFLAFGLWSLWEAYNEDDDDNEELAQVEKELADDDSKKQTRHFLTKIFSPVLLCLATIGLAADEDTVAVILGGILGQAICTVATVIGGKSLASRISERLVTVLGGVVFLIFGVHSFLSPGD